MARPSAATLNSLVQVLHLAQPLYNECRLILNYLDHNDGIALPLSQENTQHNPDCNPANEDAASISLTVFERIRYTKGIV